MKLWFWRKGDEQKVEAKSQEAEPKQFVEITTEQPTDGAWLEATTRDGQNIYIPLVKSPIEIGSAGDCDVKLPEGLDGIDKIKSRHARVELWRGRWVIVPTGVDAPVFVNGKRTGENVLKDGMEVSLGENGVRFVFREAKVRE